MKEPRKKGVANHLDLESSAGCREVPGEARCLELLTRVNQSYKLQTDRTSTKGSTHASDPSFTPDFYLPDFYLTARLGNPHGSRLGAAARRGRGAAARGAVIPIHGSG